MLSLRRRISVITLSLGVVFSPLVVELAPAGATAPTITTGTTTAYKVNNGVSDVAHDGNFNAVKCLPAISGDPAGCVAVGTNEGTQHPLVATGPLTGPLVASYASSLSGRALLNDVWCATSQHCVAIGWDQVSPSEMLAYAYDGTTWTQQTVVDADANGAIQGLHLSCSDIEHCIATGYWATASAPGGPSPMVALEVNGVWKVESVTPPGIADRAGYTNPPNNETFSVSCVTGNFCAVGGLFSTAADGQSAHPMVGVITLSSLSSTFTWSYPASSMSDFVKIPSWARTYVSCASSSFCRSLNLYVDSSTATHLMTSTFDGTSWSPTTSLATDRGPTELTCPAANQCFAATGTYKVLHFTQSGMTEDSASDSTDTWLNGISCIDVTNCVAAGAMPFVQPDPANPIARNTVFAISLWDGSSWTDVSPSINLTAAGGSNDWRQVYRSVSCTHAGECMAVGNVYFTTEKYFGVNLGIGWAAASTPFSFRPVVKAAPTRITFSGVKVKSHTKRFSIVVSANGTPLPSFSMRGTWPRGLTLSGSTISGKIRVPGTYRVKVRATNSEGFVNRVLTLKVT